MMVIHAAMSFLFPEDAGLERLAECEARMRAQS